jgi:shikimate kinase
VTRANLVLLGYRGTGKSTVGAILGARMKRPVVSIDAEIVRTAGRPIPEIVAQHGWPHFRDLESAEVRRAAGRDHIVIDAGGGVVLRKENIETLRATGYCVLLTASVSAIARRIGGDANRPSLTGKSIVDEIEEVLAERRPLYANAGELIIDTDHREPEEIAALILESEFVRSLIESVPK